jgi:hypothetical protein
MLLKYASQQRVLYKAIREPVVLYGCEAWSLTLREKHRMRVFENRVLWKVFELKRNAVTATWRKLHKEELYDLYPPNIIRMIKSRRTGWAGHVARRGEVHREFWWENLWKETTLKTKA